MASRFGPSECQTDMLCPEYLQQQDAASVSESLTSMQPLAEVNEGKKIVSDAFPLDPKAFLPRNFDAANWNIHNTHDAADAASAQREHLADPRTHRAVRQHLFRAPKKICLFAELRASAPLPAELQWARWRGMRYSEKEVYQASA